jgi:hypothetical protein
MEHPAPLGHLVMARLGQAQGKAAVTQDLSRGADPSTPPPASQGYRGHSSLTTENIGALTVRSPRRDACGDAISRRRLWLLGLSPLAVRRPHACMAACVTDQR